MSGTCLIYLFNMFILYIYFINICLYIYIFPYVFLYLCTFIYNIYMCVFESFLWEGVVIRLNTMEQSEINKCIMK